MPCGADEFGLIERHFAPLAAGWPGAFGLKDDAALLGAADGRVVTADMLVEGTHFLPDDPPGTIARKALRVSLSDLAAMGATPEAYCLALQIPPQRDEAWIAGLASGLAADQARYGVWLIGGDTVGAPAPAMLTVTAFGRLAHGPPLRRSGAAAGDDLWVSGTIGDGGLGLRVCPGAPAGLDPGLDAGLDANGRRFAIDRYRLPQPRVELGPALVGIATACLDISDGLVADLGHLARASGLAAEVRLADMPWSEAAAASDFPEIDRITAGDDYELLFAAAPADRAAVMAAARRAATPVTRVGTLRPGSTVTVRGRDGAPLVPARSGWRHR